MAKGALNLLAVKVGGPKKIESLKCAYSGSVFSYIEKWVARVLFLE